MSLTVSGVTDGVQGCAPPPWQAKCKKWAPLFACISGFCFLLIFVGFVFSVFQKFLVVFSGDFGC